MVQLWLEDRENFHCLAQAMKITPKLHHNIKNFQMSKATSTYFLSTYLEKRGRRSILLLFSFVSRSIQSYLEETCGKGLSLSMHNIRAGGDIWPNAI